MTPEGDVGVPPRHDCVHAVMLSRRVDADELDAALGYGLMDFVPCPSCDPRATAVLLEARRKLTQAWTARDRYRERNARLAGRAAERDARRARIHAEVKSPLPPSVAAILARAKAKAAEGGAK